MADTLIAEFSEYKADLIRLRDSLATHSQIINGIDPQGTITHINDLVLQLKNTNLSLAQLVDITTQVEFLINKGTTYLSEVLASKRTSNT